MHRSDLTRNSHRQLPAASELDSMLVRHSLAAGGCRLRDARGHKAFGGTPLWVAVKRYVHHAFQAYINATRFAGGSFTFAPQIRAFSGEEPGSQQGIVTEVSSFLD